MGASDARGFDSAPRCNLLIFEVLMGWRVNQRYEDARKSDHRAWLRSLPLVARMQWYGTLAIRMTVVIVVAGTIAYILLAR